MVCVCVCVCFDLNRTAEWQSDIDMEKVKITHNCMGMIRIPIGMMLFPRLIEILYLERGMGRLQNEFVYCRSI